MEEDFKVKAPELYEAPDYTLPQFPPENPYERKGFAFDPSEANREKFRKAIRVMRFYKERDKSEIGRMGGVLNALVSINKKYDYIDPHEAYREFFGGDIPLDQAESELESIYAATEGSEDALGEFQKLDKARQNEIVREQSPNAKKRMPVYDSMGLPIANPVRDNPDYDPEKERADYEAKLDKKNTWEGYLRIRNAFSPEIVRDAMRFKTAFDSRSEAADAYIDRFIEKGNEYREAFISAVSLLSPELKAGFWDRVKSRVGDSYTDTYQNIIDAFIAPKSEGRRVYALAEEKGLIDENGNLSEDPEKISELQREYENAFGLNNLGAGTAGNIFARKNTDVKKLFDEGRRGFERRRYYRLLRDLNRNEFSYSDGEWRTFEDALVNGEYTLRSLLLGFGVGFATKNPHAAIASTSAMMYATEAGDMYADLRFNGKVKESDAANIAATYGAMATALEQLQVSRFAGFFRKNAAIPKSWREYINLGLKEGFKEYALASADETAIEVAQSTAAFAAKKWAVANADATYEQRELWEEYLESSENAIKTMPIITGGMYGAGFPFRARAYMRNMGASPASGIKAYFSPSKVLENNVRAAGTMAEGDKYFNSLIEKLGQAPEDREWLYSYYSAKTDEERSGLLAERFSDESERDEAALILQEYENFDREATREFFKSKAEIARKLKEDDQKLLNGDTTDISVLDETDENGRYVVLESAIDALGMRDNVIFADTAEELAKASGLSLEAAEEQMARGGAKGFYESGSGNIVVIRRHFSDGADALRTFAHEYGHRIMAKIREGDIGGYNRMCDDVLSIVGGERMAREILPASYSEAGSAQYLKDARAVAEEVLMRAAERVATKKVLDARNRGIWARFKRWFKGLFEEKSLADIADENLAQIALDVLQRERRFDVKLSGRSPKTSRNWRAKTPEINGAEVSGEWAIMDAGKLVASTDEGYDDRLQPRNRARQASKEQTNEIALNLDPARLNDSETTDLGAPIVDARGMVISGNGRTIAIRQAYGSERAERGDAYREFVYNRAKELGIDIPDGVKNPVLVRRVDNTGEMSMEEFAARSNKSQVAGMSVAEQAIADSRRILEAGLLDIFFPDAGGNVLAASNADFYNAFLNLVGGGEAYRNRDGSVRQNLSPRIRAAVLAAMLNPERRETVERLLDNPEGYNALINGLMQCAANLAELANKPEYDLSGELSQAVELFVETRDKGQTVDEFAAQTDMFREAPSAETMFLMRLFEENAKSSGGISGVLRQYAAECKKIDTTTQSLFGDENPTKLEKLEEAYRHYAADLSNEAGNGNLRWRDTGEPAAEEISEAQKQYEEVKSKYMGTPLWMKAPNGKRTNLTEEQWVRVRTPNFKRWFGDWETLAVINEIKDMSAKPVKLHEALDKAGIKEAFKNFGEVANERDGRKVVFPSASAGKIRRHKGFDSNTIIKHFKSLFKASIPILSEKEEIKEGHKAHGNIESVEHYVNKFSVNGSEYYIRFTVPIIRNDRSAGNVHSSAISEVSIYKNGDSTLYPLNTAGSSSPSFIDRKLSDFLNSVKPENVSKVVDENGEPLAVYHGSTAMFNEFRSKFIGHSTGTADGRGFYFTTDKSYAEGFKSKDGRVIEAFLNIRDLLDYKKKTITKAALKKIIKEIDRAEFEADGEHYFISNFGNYYDEGIDKVIDEATESNYDFCDTDVEIFNVLITSGADFDLTAKAIKNVTGKDGEIVPKDNNTTHFIIFNSNQAKSATDNIGTFNTNNPDIRWREVSEPIKQKFSSGNTSLRQIAAGFKKIDFKPGSTNFDLGGGKFDEGTKYLETKGVKNFVFDPVNRDSKTNKEAFEIVKNGGFDTTTCNNVLNVISEANVRDNIILQAAKSLRPNGTAYFTVYEGDGSGKGRQSQKDSWQEHRKTVDYLGEIKKHFGDVSLKNKVITARKPILLNEKASWFMDDSFENPVRWKDDADISDISAKVKKIIDSISDKKNKHIEVLRKISDTEADFLLKKTGLDLKGYSHSIDNYSILHILKKHGSEKELQRGQIPVTIKDIQNFPTIVSDYDDVKYAGKSKIGRDTIRFEKNIGDNLVLVFEEMRIGKKLLALSTMYIQKRKKLTSNANASSNTSETLSTSSDFQESANTPENQENNSRLKALLRQERSENPDIRWREVSEPSPEEIAEANRQKADVKAKWSNPDGSMKKGYMLAPNGKHTNLTEDQWLQVRTPNFKKWFVDWETLADFYPENEIFDIDEAYRFARENLQGKEFTSKDGYTASLGRSGIDKMNSGLARGKTANNRLHALAFANVGKLFENSELLEAEAPRDGDPNIKQYLKFYTPLFMDGEFHLIKITAKELVDDGNRLYSLEGLDIIGKSEYRGQPRDSKENSISADYPDSVKNFVKKIQEIKENVSKVVDENGEPLVVYHGTPKFDRFSIFKKGSGGYLGPAIYFTSLKTYAQKYENKWGEGGNLYDVFLSLRNPLVVKSINPAKEILKTIYGKDSVYDRRSQKQSYDTKILSSADIKKLQSKGYDGVIWEYGGSKEYAVYDSSKIKSATDNIGTYSENPDIRWKIDDPSPERVEKLRAARPVEIGENDYKGLYELNAKSAREYVLKKLRGRKYVNADTGRTSRRFDVFAVDARKCRRRSFNGFGQGFPPAA